jgi:hypothetical protein
MNHIRLPSGANTALLQVEFWDKKKAAGPSRPQLDRPRPWMTIQRLPKGINDRFVSITPKSFLV